MDGIEALLTHIGRMGSGHTLKAADQVLDTYGERGRKNNGRISIKQRQKRFHRFLNRSIGNDDDDDVFREVAKKPELC